MRGSEGRARAPLDAITPMVIRWIRKTKPLARRVALAFAEEPAVEVLMRGDQPNVGEREAAARRSIEYLRQRSLHRIWWNSAQIAIRRGHAGAPSADGRGNPPRSTKSPP